MSHIFYIVSGTWVKSEEAPRRPVARCCFRIQLYHPAQLQRGSLNRIPLHREVVLSNHTIMLATKPLTQGYNDNYIALPRPVDVSLEDLNILQSGAFLGSAGTSPGARRDQILVFNNGIAQTNKPADKDSTITSTT